MEKLENNLGPLSVDYECCLIRTSAPIKRFVLHRCGSARSTAAPAQAFRGAVAKMKPVARKLEAVTTGLHYIYIILCLHEEACTARAQ